MSEESKGMDEHPIVSVYDPATGETEKAELPPDEYIVLTGARREIAHMQIFGNGAVQMTIKRKDPDA